VEDGTLTINNIQKTNEGYYLCEAVNGIGSGLSAVILISVQGMYSRKVCYETQASKIAQLWKGSVHKPDDLTSHAWYINTQTRSMNILMFKLRVSCKMKLKLYMYHKDQ